ncbi:MAG: hypothetical protein AAGK26_10850, partial [Pseudomonadota bacterium]
LDTEAGMDVWKTTTRAEDTSNWLLFERGYTYEGLNRPISGGVSGEDELHPLHITSYGEGDLPVLKGDLRIFQESSYNIVFSDVHLGSRLVTLSGNNLIFEDVEFGDDASLQNGEGITIRDSITVDVARDDPVRGGDFFQPHADRISGLYMAGNDGILLENNLWDHNGWTDGYSYDGAAEDGQAPSKFSHNVYLQFDTRDVTFRDNITMRAASVGAQLRGGAFIEDNLFLHNNVAVNFLGGEGHLSEGANEGNYSLFTNNVVTSAQFLDAIQIGAQARGVDDYGNDSTLLDNIITHLADPNDPASLAARDFSNGALNFGRGETFYDDTIVYNWHGATGDPEAEDANIDGLNQASLDQTTIQIFTAQLLGNPDATIDDLADYLRANDTLSEGQSNAEVINAFFQEGFGLSVDARLDAETLRFVPNDLGDGVRWDNRLNWDTNDLPGTIDGDSVDLGGNWVMYGGTTKLDDFTFGDGGTLNVNHGALTVEDELEADARGGTFNIAESGQVIINGYNDSETIDLNIDGGRFVNTGDIQGNVDTHITDGQAILATADANFDVAGAGRLEISGSDAKVGFDGDTAGPAVLRFETGADLSFTADEDGFSTIEEFRSGRYGDESQVESGVNLNDVALTLDVGMLKADSGSFTLMDVDEMIGEFGSVDIQGLGANQSAEVLIDYATDEVVLSLSAGGQSSGVTISTIGDPSDATSSNALWDALTEGFEPLPDDPMPEEAEEDLLMPA